MAPLITLDPDDLSSVGEPEAVALFADRARRVDPHFSLTGQARPVVTQLVQRLDGMPLAIELAAARVESLGVDQLLDRLDDRKHATPATRAKQGGGPPGPKSGKWEGFARFGATKSLGMRLASAVAAAAMLAGFGLVATSPAQAATTKVHLTAEQKRMDKAIAVLRAKDPALAHESKAQLETMLNKLMDATTKSGEVSYLAGRVNPDNLPASRSGDTIWFNRWQVALWATAGTAVVIAALIALGAAFLVAAETVMGLIALFWSAVWANECAWFTYGSPRSWGMYRC